MYARYTQTVVRDIPYLPAPRAQLALWRQAHDGRVLTSVIADTVRDPNDTVVFTSSILAPLADACSARRGVGGG